jgi:hypothetical protein
MSWRNTQLIWDKFHKRSKAVNDGNLKAEEFDLELKELPKKIPCSKCRLHLIEYMIKHPIEEYSDKFLYMFNLHNEVNQLTGKSKIDYETCKKLYS